RREGSAPLREFQNRFRLVRRSRGERAKERQADGEGGALAGSALDGNLSAVGIDDRLADAQTEAGSAGGAVANPRLVGPIEPLEDVRQIFGRDAQAVVANTQVTDAGIVVADKLDRHASLTRSVPRLATLAHAPGRREFD